MNSGVAAWFADSSPRAGAVREWSPRAWTCLGLLAIPLWATWPALALSALSIPAFECLTIAFLFAWLVLARFKRPAGARGAASVGTVSSWLPAIVCALGLTGSNAFHIMATHYIPAAESNLISYLWPVEIIGLGALAGLFRLRVRHFAGLLVGVSGAVILIGGGTVSLSITGVALAFVSGISWASYCLFRLAWKGQAVRVLQRGCAISTFLCAALHFTLEPTVIPDAGALAASTAVGIVPLALGNLVWDEGFRRGDSQLLAVMAYATPLCAALLLVALGLEPATRDLLIGAVLIVTAGFLSHTKASER